MSRLGPRTEGGRNARPTWLECSSGEETQSQKGNYWARAGAGSKASPRLARPGEGKGVRQSRPRPPGASSQVGGRHPRLLKQHTFKSQLRCALRKKEGSRFLYRVHSHKPVNRLPAPLSLLFFSDAGLSPWSQRPEQGLFFVRKGNHKSCNLGACQTSMLGCKCWCREGFHN